jgi:hypothetical protein
MKEDDVYYRESAPGVLRLLRACLVAVLQLFLTSGKVKVAHLCLQILRTHKHWQRYHEGAEEEVESTDMQRSWADSRRRGRRCRA